MIVKSNSMLLCLALVLAAVPIGCSHPSSRNAASGRSQVESPGHAVQPAVPAIDNTVPQKPQATAKDTRPVIVAFGDSLTAGYGAPAGHSYPDYLQRDLNALGYSYRVVNEGISGNTTKDGVDRLPEVLSFHPVVCIVSFGGNDGLRGIPIEDTEKNLDTIISTLQAAHAKVVLGGITLPPNYGKAYISKFDSIYQKAKRRYGVPLLPFMLKNAYGVPGDIQTDGIHPTAKGNIQVAKNFLPLLLSLLKKHQEDKRTPSPAR